MHITCVEVAESNVLEESVSVLNHVLNKNRKIQSTVFSAPCRKVKVKQTGKTGINFVFDPMLSKI